VIVQLAIGCLGVFSDFLSVTPTDVKKDIGKEYEAEIATLDAEIAARKQTLAEQEALLDRTNKQLASAQQKVGELQMAVNTRDVELAKTKSTLNEAISSLPISERRRFQNVILREGG
jgi:septal ring factor EnvC (AmiA/AmiB activator)